MSDAPVTVPAAVYALAVEIIASVQERHAALITAESCTGGLVAAALTSVPGASAAVLGGIVAYANEAKMELLGVPEALIAEYGAVSEIAAKAMSEGAILAGRHIAAQGKNILAVAVTGIAGPGGGSADKPVGTVHLAVRHYPSGKVLHRALALTGSREAIRAESVFQALRLLQQMVAGL